MYDEFPAPLLFKIPNKKYEIRNKVESRKSKGGRRNETITTGKAKKSKSEIHNPKFHCIFASCVSSLYNFKINIMIFWKNITITLLSALFFVQVSAQDGVLSKPEGTVIPDYDILNTKLSVIDQQDNSVLFMQRTATSPHQ